MFINYDLLSGKLPCQKTVRIAIPLKMHDINSSKYKTDEYIFILFYFISSKDDDFLIYIYI